MIARLRELADRPISDGERRRLFAAAALLIVLAAVLLSVTGQPATTDRPTIEPAAPPSVVEPPRDEPPGVQGVEGSDASTRAAPEPVQRAARRFLKGYLAYLYGRGDADEIDPASPALERRLQRERLRVSPATRRRDPRIADVGARRLERDRYLVTATIADGGVADYPVELTLARRSGEWVVNSTAAD